MYFKKISKRKAELSTVLTIGAFVFIGVTSIISAVFSPQRTTAKARASEILSDACKQRVDNKVYVFFKRNGARPVCSVDQIRQGTQNDPIDSWLVDESKSCTTNSNCGDGAWCYFFENKASKARCMTRDLTCDNGVCLSASSGSSSNNPSPNPGSNTQSAPGGNQSGYSQSSYSANSCFSIRADFEVRNDGDRKAFYSWVTFRSQTPGSLSLYFNNAGIAGPNFFGGGEYTYNPVWTQPFTHSNEAPAVVLSKGQSSSIWYRGFHSGCGSAQVIDITCSLSYDNNGSTIVSGTGCSCRNCQIFSPPPTLTPRPPSNRSHGTSSGSRLTPTPTLKVTTTNQITKGQDGAPCTVDSDCISNYCNLQLEGGVCQSKSNKTSLTLDNSRQNQGNLPNPTLNPSINHAWSKFREQENATRRSTSATIPTPTPTPDLCNFESLRSCIDWNLNNNLNEIEIVNLGLSKCYLPGESGGPFTVVGANEYNEVCFYSFKQGYEIRVIQGLKGSRTILREPAVNKIKKELKNIEKYSCVYSVKNEQGQYIRCNYDDNNLLRNWSEKCSTYCKLENHYEIRVIISQSFFAKYFERDDYSGGDVTFVIKNQTKNQEKIAENNELTNMDSSFIQQKKQIGHQLRINLETKYLQEYFRSINNPFTLEIGIAKNPKDSSGKTNVISINNPLTIDKKDLSIVIK